MYSDVCSSNGQEFRFHNGTDLIPQCNTIRCDAHNGVWVMVYDWNGQVTLKTSAGAQWLLGPRSASNWGAVRYVPFGDTGYFHVCVTYPENGQHKGHRWTVSADGAGLLQPPFSYTVDPTKSPDILDLDEEGEILWWQDCGYSTVDGLLVGNAMTRGQYTVCVSGPGGELGWGVAVFDGTSWFKAYDGIVFLYPRVAENGTVAVSAEPGGFITKAEWLTRPFNPHQMPDPGPDPGPDPEPEPGPDPEPEPIPEPEPTMPQRSMITLDDKTWIEVEEDKHQDANKGIGPIISVKRVSDGKYLQQGGQWTANAPGAWERAIAVPGAYVVGENRNDIVKKAGPWPQ